MNTEANLFKNYFRLMMQAKQKVFYLILEEASVKRIDLALDPELIFSEGNWRFGILS
jgi:hypothetical protein